MCNWHLDERNWNRHRTFFITIGAIEFLAIGHQIGWSEREAWSANAHKLERIRERLVISRFDEALRIEKDTGPKLARLIRPI